MDRARRMGVEPTGPAPGVRRVLTWKRSLMAGVGAFVLLSMIAAGYMGLRAAGVGPFGTLLSAGTVKERELVLLTSFTSTDTTLADAVTEVLRVDLEQSTSVAVVPLNRSAR